MTAATVDRHEGRHVHLFGRDYRWHQTPHVTHGPKRTRVTWRWTLLAERDDERAQRIHGPADVVLDA